MTASLPHQFSSVVATGKGGSPVGVRQRVLPNRLDPTARVPERASGAPFAVNPVTACRIRLQYLDPMTNASHLRLERPSDGVAVLILDNPDQRNAMSDAMTSSWVAAVDELAADQSVRVVVVTGEGSAFSSGGNTSWIA